MNIKNKNKHCVQLANITQKSFYAIKLKSQPKTSGRTILFLSGQRNCIHDLLKTGERMCHKIFMRIKCP